MKTHRLTMILVSILVLGLGCQSVQAEKRIGVSHPNYGNVLVEPNQTFSGMFTIFNTGDENLTVYVEIHGSPGKTDIEMAPPQPAGTPLKWITTNEWDVPHGTHVYARFTIQLGALVRGQWYNWSLLIGYMDPNPLPHAVAANGIQINMRWPKPIPWYYQMPQWAWLVLGFSIVFGILAWRVRRFILHYKRLPVRTYPNQPQKMGQDDQPKHR